MLRAIDCRFGQLALKMTLTFREYLDWEFGRNAARENAACDPDESRAYRAGWNFETDYFKNRSRKVRQQRIASVLLPAAMAKRILDDKTTAPEVLIEQLIAKTIAAQD